MIWLTLLLVPIVLIVVPALYYAPDTPEAPLAMIFEGLIFALLPLLETLREWQPGAATLPDLAGWGYGLGAALFVLICGSLGAEIWRTLTDRPYRAVTVHGETLGIQRGHLGTPIEIPRRQIRGVHVGRRAAGTHEVLVAHGDSLTPVAIIGGNERRALLLKTKIEDMLEKYAEGGDASDQRE